jgi:hypothetical protein
MADLDLANMDPKAHSKTGVQCFLTGSRAYGTPRPFSDYDFVLALPLEVARLLDEFADEGSDPPGSVSLRFNRLNLIIPTSEESLEVWRQGTQDLIAKKPVQREAAMAHFKKLRAEAGVE